VVDGGAPALLLPAWARLGYQPARTMPVVCRPFAASSRGWRSGMTELGRVQNKRLRRPDIGLLRGVARPRPGGGDSGSPTSTITIAHRPAARGHCPSQSRRCAEFALPRGLRGDRDPDPFPSESFRADTLGSDRPDAATGANVGALWRRDQRRHRPCVPSGSRHEANLELQDRGQTGWRTDRTDRAGSSGDHAGRRAHRDCAAPTKGASARRALARRGFPKTVPRPAGVVRSSSRCARGSPPEA